MARVQLERLSKQYGDQLAVENVDLAIADGELVTLLGPSGCGKTTTLRMVAGFIPPSSGRISIGDRLVSDAATGLVVPPNERRLGMVFQSYAVWPHMTVFDNVGYPLKVRGLPMAERRRRVLAALDQVKLAGLDKRYPHQLSGGQQQRVALARALIMEPELLLLDEPLSNLDAKLREEMRDELRALQHQLGITILFVTHDQVEAMTLSDRVVVMDRGRVQQVGSPQEVYEQPVNRFVATFVGAANLLPALVAVSGDRVEVPGLPNVWLPFDPADRSDGVGEWSLLVRPETVELVPAGASDGGFAGRVLRAVYAGDAREYVVQDAQGQLPPLRARTPASLVFPAGSEVTVKLHNCRLLPG